MNFKVSKICGYSGNYICIFQKACLFLEDKKSFSRFKMFIAPSPRFLDPLKTDDFQVISTVFLETQVDIYVKLLRIRANCGPKQTRTYWLLSEMIQKLILKFIINALFLSTNPISLKLKMWQASGGLTNPLNNFCLPRTVLLTGTCL